MSRPLRGDYCWWLFGGGAAADIGCVGCVGGAAAADDIGCVGGVGGDVSTTAKPITAVTRSSASHGSQDTRTWARLARLRAAGRSWTEPRFGAAGAGWWDGGSLRWAGDGHRVIPCLASFSDLPRPFIATLSSSPRPQPPRAAAPYLTFQRKSCHV